MLTGDLNGHNYSEVFKNDLKIPLTQFLNVLCSLLLEFINCFT